MQVSWREPLPQASQLGVSRLGALQTPPQNADPGYLSGKSDWPAWTAPPSRLYRYDVVPKWVGPKALKPRIRTPDCVILPEPGSRIESRTTHRAPRVLTSCEGARVLRTDRPSFQSSRPIAGDHTHMPDMMENTRKMPCATMCYTVLQCATYGITWVDGSLRIRTKKKTSQALR